MINFIPVKLKLQEFVNFIKINKQIKNKFLLTLVIFILLPTYSYNLLSYVNSPKPVIRPQVMTLPELSLYPVNVTGQLAPWLTANAVMVIDVPSKTIIFAKNPDTQLLPASTTKIMTALVTLDFYKLTAVLEVRSLNSIGQTMNLELGERITVENLLYGLLVQSGNDAALLLAENYPGGVKGFVAAMNKKAKEFNLLQTNFVNPTGVEDYGHLSSAHDLAILGAQAMKNEKLASIVATPAITISNITGDIQHELKNVNRLVGKVTGLKGIKTGWTENAGECLIAYMERDKGKIITVVLGSKNRFTETETLINWVFDNFSWQTTKSIPD